MVVCYYLNSKRVAADRRGRFMCSLELYAVAPMNIRIGQFTSVIILNFIFTTRISYGTF